MNPWKHALPAGVLLAAAVGFTLSRQPETPTAVAPGPALRPPATTSIQTDGSHADQLNALLAQRDSAAQRARIAELLAAWLAEDPQAFAVWLDAAEIQGDAIWGRFSPAFFMALGELEPAVASSFALRDLAGRVVALTAGTDPQRALAWAREWLSDAHLDAALAEIAGEWVAQNPDGAMALVGEIRAMAHRMEAAATVGAAVGAQDPARGMAWAESFGTEIDRTFAWSGVLTGMAGRDSGSAGAEFSRLAEEMKASYRERVIADRARSGTAVEEEYEGLSPEEILKAELARPNPNLIYLEKAAYLIGAAMARQDPAAGLAWARSLDVYQGSVAAATGVLEEWAGQAPDDAFRAFSQLTDRRPELAAGLFETWAVSDPQAAADAAVRLVDGKERGRALEAVAQGWLDAGAPPAEVAAWSDRLGTAGERDAVRAVVAAGASYEDPELAWRQIDRIRNRTTQAGLFQDVFPNLVARDPDLARRALHRLHLPPVESEYYRSMLGD